MSNNECLLEKYCWINYNNMISRDMNTMKCHVLLRGVNDFNSVIMSAARFDKIYVTRYDVIPRANTFLFRGETRTRMFISGRQRIFIQFLRVYSLSSRTIFNLFDETLIGRPRFHPESSMLALPMET